MAVQEIAIPGFAEPLGPYAHATCAGNLIFVSGLLAIDQSGALVGAGDAAAQAEQIFATLATILDAAGSDLQHVAKLSFYLRDLADRAALTEVRRRVFGAHRPASTLVQVAGLMGEGTLLEVDAMAVKKTVVPEKEDPPSLA
jgi:2-iminobutanoate/2-iminopropanoate deaminase